MVFERIGGFSEIVQKIAEERAKQLDEKIRASIEGSTILFFDIEFQKFDGGHPDYQTHTQTIVRVATDGEPVEEPLPSGATAKHITNRFKWKISVLPWTDEDESAVFNYDWHKNERWKEPQSLQGSVNDG